jgi:hypothetical protein
MPVDARWKEDSMSLWGAIKHAAKSIGNAVASAVGAVGDAVEEAVNAAVDATEDVVDAAASATQTAVDYVTDWANKELGGFVGAIVSFLGGVINGAVQGIRDITHSVAAITRDIAHIGGSIFRLDFAAVVKSSGDLVIDVVGLFVNVGRVAVGGTIVGGVIDQFERRSLRNFVENLLVENFGKQPEILNEIRSKLGLKEVSWGVTGQRVTRATMVAPRRA